MLTTESLRAYWDDGKCPFCQSEGVDHSAIVFKGLKGSVTSSCKSCGKAWIDRVTTTEVKPKKSNLDSAARKKGNKAQAELAVTENWSLVVDLYKLQADNLPLRTIGLRLWEAGHRSRTGGGFEATTVARLLKRFSKLDLDWTIQMWKGLGWADHKGGFKTYKEEGARKW